MSLFNKLFIQCKEASYLHQKKQEGQLDVPERFGLWFHLLYCKFCRQFVKQVELIESAAHKFYQSAEQRFHLTPARKAELQKAFDEQLNK